MRFFHFPPLLHLLARTTVGCSASSLPGNARTMKGVLRMRFEPSSPNLFDDSEPQSADIAAGWLLLVATPGSEPGGRWFDSNPRNFSSRSHATWRTGTHIP